jgi:hypothetical protein
MYFRHLSPEADADVFFFRGEVAEGGWMSDHIPGLWLY